MKIGLNATCFDERPSGAKQRFIGIYNELFRYLVDDQFVIYMPFGSRMESWFPKFGNVSFKETPLLANSRIRKYLRGKLYWHSALRSEAFDIFEGFHQPPCYPREGRKLLTIHDTRRISQSELWSWREQFTYRRVLNSSLRLADHVVAVSDFSRQEINELFPKVSVSVIYNGVDAELFQNIPRSIKSKTRQDFDLPNKFLLAVGHFEKRKNYLRLIDAVSRLHSMGRPVNLVIVGNDSGELGAIEKKVKSLNLSEYVKIFQGLPDMEVRCFYSLCSLVVFPSSYEGFGIPILEAMAAGSPIVLSDTPVFREITEDQGAYFSHDDSEAMAVAIDWVLSSESERNRLISYGNDRVKEFGFEKIAMDLARLYRSLL